MDVMEAVSGVESTLIDEAEGAGAARKGMLGDFGLNFNGLPLTASGFLPAGIGGGPRLAEGGGGPALSVWDPSCVKGAPLPSAGWYGGGGFAVPASLFMRGGSRGGPDRGGTVGVAEPLPVTDIRGGSCGLAVELFKLTGRFGG